MSNHVPEVDWVRAKQPDGFVVTTSREQAAELQLELVKDQRIYSKGKLRGPERDDVPTPTGGDDLGPVYDPAEHDVDEVNAHLAGLDPLARGPVLAAEAAGKNRKGIVEGPHAGA